jgi:hypothetical protein
MSSDAGGTVLSNEKSEPAGVVHLSGPVVRAELERLLRYHDVDSTQLPQRVLLAACDAIGRVVLAPAELEALRTLVKRRGQREPLQHCERCGQLHGGSCPNIPGAMTTQETTTSSNCPSGRLAVVHCSGAGRVAE